MASLGDGSCPASTAGTPVYRSALIQPTAGRLTTRAGLPIGTSRVTLSEFDRWMLALIGEARRQLSCLVVVTRPLLIRASEMRSQESLAIEMCSEFQGMSR